jgi:asparagine synthase (glutamine-hydrolysing)
MHSQLLRDTDVMSMAHSLEVRVPFLDHRLVEAVVALPARLKQAGSGPKPLLHTALDGALPPLIRARAGKQGFVFPLDRWMRGPLRSTVELLLSDAEASGWLRPNAVRDIWSSYESGKLHWSRAWSLAVLGNKRILSGAGPVHARR